MFFKMIKSLAKINLFLHVLGKNSKNYHLLDSLTVFLPGLYDKIRIKKSEASEVIFTGPWKDKVSKNNTVTRTLELMSAYVPDNFQISIEKNIPVGGGLGGGSSNAGCIIKYLIDRYKVKIASKKLLQICNSVGADVAMFLFSKALYFNGTGDILTQLKKFPSINIVIVYPQLTVSTEQVYKLGFKEYAKKMSHKLFFESQDQLIEFLKLTRNALYPNALKIFPELQLLITAIEKNTGCLLAKMTGSGSACFGIFNSIKNAKLGLKSLQKEFPNYSIYMSKAQ